MSQEKVAVVENALNAFAPRWACALAEYWPTTSTTGRSRVRSTTLARFVAGMPCAYAQDWIDTFEDFRIDTVEIAEAGEDKLIAVRTAALDASDRRPQPGHA